MMRGGVCGRQGRLVQPSITCQAVPAVNTRCWNRQNELLRMLCTDGAMAVLPISRRMARSKVDGFNINVVRNVGEAYS